MARAPDRLLDTLYASILDEPPWLAFLEAMEQHVPCHHCTMVLRKPREGDAGVLIASPDNNAALAALQQHHFRDSPFLELPEGKVCKCLRADARVMPARCAASVALSRWRSVSKLSSTAMPLAMPSIRSAFAIVMRRL